MTAENPDSKADSIFKIGVAYNNTPGASKALQTAVNLVLTMPSKSYILYIVYVVALNPPALLPGMDGIEQGFNAQIHEDAKKELQECKTHLDVNYRGRVNYEFVQVEGEGDTGMLIKEYVETERPDLNMLVVGTRSLSGMQKLFLGSVSDYLVHNMNVPVLVVKNDQDAVSKKSS